MFIYSFMKYRFTLFFVFTLLVLQVQGQQKQGFTHADSLRGSWGPGRQHWNVLHYDLYVTPDYKTKTITGSNTILFTDSGVVTLQLDLQEPMQVDSITGEGKHFMYNREGNVYWVQIRASRDENFTEPRERSFTVYFHGKPIEAIRPPWDGGWIWEKDRNNNPWMSVACQGLGASVWYPCKDIQVDEPDRGAKLHITVPDSLTAVGNGRLTGKTKLAGGLTRYDWEVKSPINNYCIIPYIGKYVHFSELFNGVNGKLDMDYWVLDYNLEKAERQFKDAPRTMKAFEYWFGPYPFYEDGYKLVEAPHLGMEHQSATAYGNGYRNGYHGTDLSGSGWGMKWDFIIVHESGHEWFGNNITSEDLADMWIHESFTNYSETLFTEFHYGKDAGSAYVRGTRQNIYNDKPIIASYGVNQQGSGDMYYKGGNMLHTIRQVIQTDEKFREILTGMNRRFYHQTVTSAQIEKYISDQAGFDFSKIFDQYLRTVNIPVLEYKTAKRSVAYRWLNTVEGFNLPVKISLGKKEQWISPSGEWKTIKTEKRYDGSTFKVNKDFYILNKKLDEK